MVDEPEDLIDDEILDLGPLDLDWPFEEGPAKRVERTRALLAYLLLGLLAGLLGALLWLLYRGTVDVEEFSSIAGVVLAPVVGLLGAATGYYYGRGDR